MQRLLVGLFRFLHPFLSAAELSPPVRMLYRGALRVLLVLLHDFPEFLCDHHLDLCDVIPPNCVQMRNLVLSAFPRAMRLPDPFTPNLKVDLLPEISQSPRVTCGGDGVAQSATAKPRIGTSMTPSSHERTRASTPEPSTRGRTPAGTLKYPGITGT